MDTLKQYWNYKVFHISFTYAFVAYMWRLIRALGLVLSMIKENISKVSEKLIKAKFVLGCKT